MPSAKGTFVRIRTRGKATTYQPDSAPGGAAAASTDLTGEWRAAVADDGLRRSFPAPAFDDSSWEAVRVPHCWQAVPAFSTSSGPLLYRRAFEADVPSPGERAWLVFDGIFYQGDVWLDGSYVGDTEGWFFPHQFEVTDKLATRSEHLLAVEVGCEAKGPGSSQRSLIGIWDDPSWVAPGEVPGGIWAPVRLVRTGPVRLVSMQVSCREARAKKAVIELSIELDSTAATPVEIQVDVRRMAGTPPPLHAGRDGGAGRADLVARMLVSHPLAVGSNRSRWRVEIADPQLWWPHGLGDQPFYEVELEVRTDGERSDGRCMRTGLREVRMRDMRWSINGERLFLMGTDLSPMSPRSVAAGASGLRAQLDDARHLGLGLVRARAHVGGADLYDRADETGMLIWQDMPMRGHYGGQRGQATSQARKLTELLGHHPSVITWCAHDYPSAGSARRRVLAAWQGLVLDRAVRRSLERSDPSRPALASAGPFPGTGWAVPGAAGGWPVKRPVGIPLSGALWPSSFRFVPAVPVPSPHSVLRRQVEALRRAQWRPVGGFLLERLPQDPVELEALRAACASLIITATWPGGSLRRGDDVSFDIYVVAGLADRADGATVVAIVRWGETELAGEAPASPAAGEGRRWLFAGDFAPGSTFIGRCRFAVPSLAPEGPKHTTVVELIVDLMSPSGQRLASNHYKSSIAMP